jgi:hypothetical protein
MSEVWPVLFVVYGSAVLIWLFLADQVCRGLSHRHPMLYESLGRPALASAGPGFQSEVALLRFLVSGRDRFTGDERLSRLCAVMRSLLCAYALFFLTLPGLLLR